MDTAGQQIQLGSSAELVVEILGTELQGSLNSLAHEQSNEGGKRSSERLVETNGMFAFQS
jgi:hypothetical protein